MRITLSRNTICWPCIKHAKKTKTAGASRPGGIFPFFIQRTSSCPQQEELLQAGCLAEENFL
jgi:hypothetical protein